MEKLIIIKYGEMTTKKDNIGLFLKKLKENVAFVFYFFPFLFSVLFSSESVFSCLFSS